MPFKLDEKDIKAIGGSRYTRTHMKHYIGLLAGVVFSLGLVWSLYLTGRIPQHFFGIPLVVLVTGMILLWRSTERYKKALVDEWKKENKEEAQ